MRLDSYLYEIGKYPSRNKASEAVLKGEVLYDNKLVKPSKEVVNENLISYVTANSKYVSNGGYKLEKALLDFNFSVKDMVFADVGASNGGFTDCLFQNGAKKVYAIDVGESQLDKSLLSKNVVVMDNTNARYLSKDLFEDSIDGVVCDVSFISLTYVLPSIKAILKEGGYALVLVKPQFECGKEFLTKTGIVKDVKAKINASRKIYNASIELGLTPINFTVAPIREKKNTEYIMLIKNNIENNLSFSQIEKVIRGGL
jgi:23S rRNA (cytidine1920-2'-O)/16S rRNA (cytidine1409-2'-O)-methyltransferase